MERLPTHDDNLDADVAVLLRFGVVLAATIVLIGAVVYLGRHGTEPADYKVFRGEPEQLRRPDLIVETALSGRGRGIIQLGLLALLATPLCRVGVMFVVFVRRRNWVYAAASSLVLAALCWGLFGAGATVP